MMEPTLHYSNIPALHFLLDHPLRAQVFQLRPAQTQKTAEHLVRVLADGRRILAYAGGRLGQMNPWRQQCRRPGSRMIALNECLPCFNVRIFEHLASRQRQARRSSRGRAGRPIIPGEFCPAPML